MHMYSACNIHVASMKTFQIPACYTYMKRTCMYINMIINTMVVQVSESFMEHERFIDVQYFDQVADYYYGSM